MNYIHNKNSRFNRRINDRYFLKLDKSEGQHNINKYYNNLNNQNNIIKSYDIYNNNYYAKNKIINGKDIMQNYNINNYNNLKKDNTKKFLGIHNSRSIDNNFKYLYVTNFKNLNNLQKKAFSVKKQNNEKEENKNNEDTTNINNDSIPTIVKIQKLIESLQSKRSNNNIIKDNKDNKENKENKEYKEYKDYKEYKENDKLPSLINIKKHYIDEKSLPLVKTQKAGINNINLFSNKDLISRVNNTKIKLKNIQNNKNNKNNERINTNDIKEENQINIINIKKKEISKVKLPKVSIDKVKNIIKNNFIIDNNGNKEKIVNIRLKLNPQQTRNYFIANNQANNNTIFMKSKKESVMFCISNYNNYKADLMGLKNTFHYIEKERTKKEMLVNKNQTMFKNPLNDKKYKEENEENENDEDEMENDPKRYSKYYLPLSGFGLLSRHNN